ncbi:MAG TPA: hypothetical protein PK843_19470 [bacterium]|nr:hypothetical protein [bacterium]
MEKVKKNRKKSLSRIINDNVARARMTPFFLNDSLLSQIAALYLFVGQFERCRNRNAGMNILCFNPLMADKLKIAMLSTESHRFGRSGFRVRTCRWIAGKKRR